MTVVAGGLIAADTDTSAEVRDDAVDGGDDAGDEAVVGDPQAVEEPLAVFGDAAYGAGELLADLEDAGVEINCKVQPASAPGGRLTKDAFDIDLEAGAVTCPGEQTTRIRPAKAAVAAPQPSSRCAPAAPGHAVHELSSRTHHQDRTLRSAAATVYLAAHPGLVEAYVTHVFGHQDAEQAFRLAEAVDRSAQSCCLDGHLTDGRAATCYCYWIW